MLRTLLYLMYNGGYLFMEAKYSRYLYAFNIASRALITSYLMWNIGLLLLLVLCEPHINPMIIY